MSWKRTLLAVLATLVAMSPNSFAQRQFEGVWDARRKDKDNPLPRVKEMIDWIAVEQQDDGGWAHRLWLPLRYHIHQGTRKPKVPPQSQDMNPKRSQQERDSFLPSSFDTAMCGLALLRAGNTLSTGDRNAEVKRAADYLYRMIQSAGPQGVTIDFRPTPLTDRIGQRADTFAALIFFLTLREKEFAARETLAAKKGEAADRSFAYDGAIGTLVTKSQQTVGPDGNWPGAGKHAPILSSALGCWALEAAMRAGFAVKPDVLARAERYAMSKEAEQEHFKAQAAWRKEGYFKRPRQTRHELFGDNDPLGQTLYLMAARLMILYQADLTNRTLLERKRAASKGKSITEAEYAEVSAFAAAAKRTQASLDTGRGAMRKTWTTVHKNDIEPSPSPIFFTGEDYLSSLMVVDAMANSPDVEKWFPPIVRWLMPQQDMDGGLRIQDPILCPARGCLCGGFGPAIVAGKVQRPKEIPLIEFFLEPQFCPQQQSWCSRDRTLATAAGLMILLADTPYRPAFMGKK